MKNILYYVKIPIQKKPLFIMHDDANEENYFKMSKRIKYQLHQTTKNPCNMRLATVSP